MGFLLVADEREDGAASDGNVRVAGELEHAESVEGLFIAPGVAGDDGDAEDLDLGGLEQGEDGHLIGTAGAGAVLIHKDEALLRKAGRYGDGKEEQKGGELHCRVLSHTRHPAPGKRLASRGALSATESMRAGGRRDGQVGFAGGIDGKKAILAFPGACGLDAFDVAKGHVEEAALAAVHGLECVGDARSDDFVGSDFSGHAEFLGAERLEVPGIEADEVVLALLEAEHLGGDGFKRAQKFSAVLGEEGNVGAAELNVDLTGFKPLWVAGAIACCDAVFEAHAPQPVERRKQSSNLLGSFLQVSDRHNSLVSQMQKGNQYGRRILRAGGHLQSNMRRCGKKGERRTSEF